MFADPARNGEEQANTIEKQSNLLERRRLRDVTRKEWEAEAYEVHWIETAENDERDVPNSSAAVNCLPGRAATMAYHASATPSANIAIPSTISRVGLREDSGARYLCA